MSQVPLKVIIGDLRHSTIGHATPYFPVAAGYISTYATARLGEGALEVHLETDPAETLDLIKELKPDVVALSNYIWNTKVSYFVLKEAKRLLGEESVYCIAGGPQFPRDQESSECLEHLLSHPEIDSFVYREGEVPFSDLLIELASGKTVKELRASKVPGVMSVDPVTGELVRGPNSKRLMNLDDIPSPYLTGLMDKFFDGPFQPFLESARGCPYLCTYCDAGAEWYNKIASFSVDRIGRELEYIAKRMRKTPRTPLNISDSNFGMLKRDEEIADIISSLKDKYGWPLKTIAATGKSQLERVARVNKKMGEQLSVGIALQSLHKPTLDAVKRKNLVEGVNLTGLSEKMRELGLHSYSSDLITPLPGETKETFFDGFRQLSDASVTNLIPYTPMLLIGTEISSKETREKYGFVAKYRPIPRQFGVYSGKKIFEKEEVCIATNTMSFSDYLDCRGFSFVVKFLSLPQFEFIDAHVRDFSLNKFDVWMFVWEKAKSEKSGFGQIYEAFIAETAGELFETEKSIDEEFEDDQKYNELVTGEIGANLMNKYVAKGLLLSSKDMIHLIYQSIKSALNGRGDLESRAWLDSAEKFFSETRGIEMPWVEATQEISKPLTLPFAVSDWLAHAGEKRFSEFSETRTLQFSLNGSRISEIRETAQALFSRDPLHWFPKIIESTPLEEFWFVEKTES
jgi:radical SAM superfamily enzyme YgiQ (UPF0313 family)